MLCVCVHMYMHVFSVFKKIPSSVIARSQGKSVFNFYKKQKLCPEVTGSLLSHQQ